VNPKAMAHETAIYQLVAAIRASPKLKYIWVTKRLTMIMKNP
jgi:hypothetical protein